MKRGDGAGGFAWGALAALGWGEDFGGALGGAGGGGTGSLSTRGSPLCLARRGPPRSISPSAPPGPMPSTSKLLPTTGGQAPRGQGDLSSPRVSPSLGGSSGQPGVCSVLWCMPAGGSRAARPLGGGFAEGSSSAWARHGDGGRWDREGLCHPSAAPRGSPSHTRVPCLGNRGRQLPAVVGLGAGLLWRHASVPRVLSHLSGVLFLCRARKPFACSPLGFGQGQAAARCPPAAPGVPPPGTCPFLPWEANTSIQFIPNHTCVGAAHVTLWLSWNPETLRWG